jgi:excisionase family DNA binding protein
MADYLLTPKELAKELGVKLSTVYYWSHIGYIPTVKMGRLIRFRKRSIESWLSKKEKPGRKSRHPRLVDIGS